MLGYIILIIAAVVIIPYLFERTEQYIKKREDDYETN